MARYNTIHQSGSETKCRMLTDATEGSEATDTVSLLRNRVGCLGQKVSSLQSGDSPLLRSNR